MVKLMPTSDESEETIKGALSNMRFDALIRNTNIDTHLEWQQNYWKRKMKRSLQI